MTGANHVPVEAWPETTRRAIYAAYAAKAEEVAERIRSDPSWQRCSCQLRAAPAGDGRCSRCWGSPT